MIYNIKYLAVEIRNKEFTGNINIHLLRHDSRET